MGCCFLGLEWAGFFHFCCIFGAFWGILRLRWGYVLRRVRGEGGIFRITGCIFGVKSGENFL